MSWRREEADARSLLLRLDGGGLMKGNEDVQTWRWESMMSVDVVVVVVVGGVGGWVDMRKKKAMARAVATKGVEDEMVAR